ncbi:MAG: tetratricopeptide repeat protein, partial [Planctomycetes bacterium]|nr:tetratricopeptide repeat protein [Planctomycetota bacterium]
PAPDPERQKAALAMNLEAHRLAEAGEIEHAILTFERLATLYPESFLAPRADFAAASLVGRDGPRAGAERFLRFVEKRPAHELADDALCEAAALVLALEDVEETRTLLRRVLAEYPGGDRAAEAAFRLGKVEEEAGRREDALAAYRFAFEAYPGTSWASQALARHRELEVK